MAPAGLPSVENDRSSPRRPVAPGRGRCVSICTLHRQISVKAANTKDATGGHRTGGQQRGERGGPADVDDAVANACPGVSILTFVIRTGVT
jgi:hypothetical protein